MHEQDILKILQGFNSIKPDKEYSENSRMIILASKQNEAAKTPWLSIKHAIEVFRLSAAVGIISFLLLTLMGGVSYLNNNFSPLALDGLNQNSLKTEAAGIDSSIEITLEQIKYLNQSNKKAISSIDQVSKNKPVYTETPTTTTVMPISTEATSTLINPKEQPQIEITETTSSSINDLLDQISK